MRVRPAPFMPAILSSKDIEKIRSQAKIAIPRVDPQPKQNKYMAIKTEVDNITFDSQHEAERYRTLSLLQRQGEIEGLRLQVPYPMIINGVKVCKYVADFVYTDTKTGEVIVEDSKSDMTRKLQVYRMKKKLMRAVHNIEVKES